LSGIRINRYERKRRKPIEKHHTTSLYFMRIKKNKAKKNPDNKYLGLKLKA